MAKLSKEERTPTDEVKLAFVKDAMNRMPNATNKQIEAEVRRMMKEREWIVK